MEPVTWTTLHHCLSHHSPHHSSLIPCHAGILQPLLPPLVQPLFHYGPLGRILCVGAALGAVLWLLATSMLPAVRPPRPEVTQDCSASTLPGEQPDPEVIPLSWRHLPWPHSHSPSPTTLARRSKTAREALSHRTILCTRGGRCRVAAVYNWPPPRRSPPPGLPDTLARPSGAGCMGPPWRECRGAALSPCRHSARLLGRLCESDSPLG